MTKGELLDKLKEFADCASEVVGLAEDIRDFGDDLYYDIKMIRRELETDDDER